MAGSKYFVFVLAFVASGLRNWMRDQGPPAFLWSTVPILSAMSRGTGVVAAYQLQLSARKKIWLSRFASALVSVPIRWPSGFLLVQKTDHWHFQPSISKRSLRRETRPIARIQRQENQIISAEFRGLLGVQRGETHLATQRQGFEAIAAELVIGDPLESELHHSSSIHRSSSSRSVPPQEAGTPHLTRSDPLTSRCSGEPIVQFRGM
jgi:hypothetical protein